MTRGNVKITSEHNYLSQWDMQTIQNGLWGQEKQWCPVPVGQTRSYLDGSGCDLDVVQSPKGAVPVDEVGGRELVQRLQGD